MQFPTTRKAVATSSVDVTLAGKETSTRYIGLVFSDGSAG